MTQKQLIAQCQPLGKQLFQMDPVVAVVSGPHELGGVKALAGPLYLMLEAVAGCFSVSLEREFPCADYDWYVQVTASPDSEQGLTDFNIIVWTTNPSLTRDLINLRHMASACPAVRVLGHKYIKLEVKSPLAY